jgi:hypothetical protein
MAKTPETNEPDFRKWISDSRSRQWQHDIGPGRRRRIGSGPGPSLVSFSIYKERFIYVRRENSSDHRTATRYGSSPSARPCSFQVRLVRKHRLEALRGFPTFGAPGSGCGSPFGSRPLPDPGQSAPRRIADAAPTPVVIGDVLGELIVSNHVLGTAEILLLNHTGCGFTTFTDDEMNAKVSASTGDASPAPMRFFSYKDPEENTREQIKKVGSHPRIANDVPVRGSFSTWTPAD